MTYTASAAAGFTLPYTLWPAGKPFIVQRAVWIDKVAVADDEIIISDAQAAANVWLHLVSTGADYEPPQEWKRHRFDGAPMGAIIRTFSSGVLYLYL